MQHALDGPNAALRRSQVQLALAILVVVVVGAVLWLGRSDPRAISPTSQMSTHQLPELGIEFDYPWNWHLQEFDENLGLASMTGALVSNIRHDLHHPDLGPDEGTSAWDMRGLPEDLIVISFEQLDRHNSEATGDERLPLELANALVSEDAKHGVDTYGAPQPRLFLPFAAKGHLSSAAQVFIGDVGADEHEVVDAILGSVRPIRN